MDSNTHSTQGPTGSADELAELSALLDRLQARDLDRLTGPARAERVLQLRRLADRLDGQWLNELAGVDARGGAGAEQDRQFGSTAGWLRARLLMASGTATTAVRTARALFRGPLPNTAAAVMNGELSATHAAVLAPRTQHLADHVIHHAEATLPPAARRLAPTACITPISFWRARTWLESAWAMFTAANRQIRMERSARAEVVTATAAPAFSARRRS